VLDKLGREQVHYRSWGRNGKVLGQDHEQNFKEDHDLSKGMNVAIKHPKRVAFGLPHNYGKGDKNEVKPAAYNLDRRASPLLLHIQQIRETDPPAGVIAFLPAQFLPDDPAQFLPDDNPPIRAFGRNVPLKTNGLWQPIHGYLHRLLGKEGATAKQTELIGEEVTLG